MKHSLLEKLLAEDKMDIFKPKSKEEHEVDIKRSNYRLWGEDCSTGAYDIGTIKTYPSSISLEDIRKEVSELIDKWQDEYENWEQLHSEEIDSGVKEFTPFVSKYLPGLNGGYTELCLTDPDGKEYMWTGDWELVEDPYA